MHLFNLFIEDKCSHEQLLELAEYFDSDNYTSQLKALIEKKLRSPDVDENNISDANLDEIYQNLKKVLKSNKDSWILRVYNFN